MEGELGFHEAAAGTRGFGACTGEPAAFGRKEKGIGREIKAEREREREREVMAG
jgi:hypothetical protein